MTELSRIPVTTASGGYVIHAGTGALATALTDLAALHPNGRAVVVTDRHVADLHLDAVSKALQSIGVKTEPIIVDAGEGQKSFAGLEMLTDNFAQAGIERSETVIALGGGVIGDLTGFAASIFKRGIGFVQMPTTLLSQADSSVGGKTGINSRHGKNMVGAFHPPRLVIADAGFLKTLPVRELRSGYAEILKAALIGDADLFDRLEAAGRDVYHDAHLQPALASAIRFKAGVVARDEKESGERALLNLGHTFGHAFEAEAPGQIAHGEAVAAGLAMAFRYSVRLGICPKSDADRVSAHLRAVALPDSVASLPAKGFEAEKLLSRMRHDKKNSGQAITLVLAKCIGDAFIQPACDDTDLLDFLETELT